MRDYQTKTNVAATPDSNSATKLGGGEATSLRTESKNAVSKAGLTLAPQNGSGEDTTQLAQALMINGIAASSFQSGGTANAITLVPVTGSAGLLLPPDYTTLDGMQISFFAGFNNTSATTFSIGQTVGTQFGTKKILDESGAALSGGEIVAGERVDFIFDQSADGGSGAGILRKTSVDISGKMDKSANLSDVANAATSFNNIKQSATISATGVVEKSTSAENIAGVATGKFPDVPGVEEMIREHGWTTLTKVTTSGTSNDIDGIPSTATIIFISFKDVDTNTTNPAIIQLKDSGGAEITGYTSSSHVANSSTLTITNGLRFTTANMAQMKGAVMLIKNSGSNTWTAFGSTTISSIQGHGVGDKTLSSLLSGIRLTTELGTAVFSAGSYTIEHNG